MLQKGVTYPHSLMHNRPCRFYQHRTASELDVLQRQVPVQSGRSSESHSRICPPAPADDRLVETDVLAAPKTNPDYLGIGRMVGQAVPRNHFKDKQQFITENSYI